MREGKIKIPELLSPAADMQCLVAAVENGCDAVYIGGKNFSARSGAVNFTNKEIQEATEYCHLRGVKIYVTVNTLYKQDELSNVYEFVKEVYLAGVDAVITTDFGVSKRIMKAFPEVDIFASTQMTVGTLDGAKFMQDNGFSRVVLARELPLDEIRKIISGTTVETEIFAHGAMCYAYSGQCLMSGLIGGRSGNRGQCAQPCRLNYALMQGRQQLVYGSLLSMRDLCTLPLLNDIVSSGVTGLKIEGRQKSAQYVAAATGAYRRALDAIASGEARNILEDEDRLARVFCRDGKYTQGYLCRGEVPSPSTELVCKKTVKHLGPKIGHVAGVTTPPFGHPSDHPVGCAATHPQEGDFHPHVYTIRAMEDMTAGDGVSTFDINGEAVGAAVNVNVSAGQSFTIMLDAELEAGAPIYKSHDKAVLDALSRTFNRSLRKLPVIADVSVRLGEKVSMTLSLGNISVLCEGEVVQPAQNSPVSRESILEKLSKAGDTTFKIEFRNIEIDGGVFIPVSQLNALRREVCEKFQERYIAEFARNSAVGELADFIYESEPLKLTESGKKLTVYTYEAEQLEAALNVSGVARYMCEARPALLRNLDDFSARAHSIGAKLFVALPAISEGEEIQEIVDIVEASTADGYLITNWGQFAATSNSGKKRIAGAQFGAMNHATCMELKKLADTITLSAELSLAEAAELGNGDSELIIHGRHVAYITRCCPVDSTNKPDAVRCAKRTNTRSYESDYFLVDRKGMELPVVRDCENCRAMILYGQCLSMLDRLSEVDRTNIGLLRLSFTNEPPQVVASVIETYVAALSGNMTTLPFGHSDHPVASRHPSKEGNLQNVGTSAPARPQVKFSDMVNHFYGEAFTHGYFGKGIQ